MVSVPTVAILSRSRRSNSGLIAYHLFLPAQIVGWLQSAERRSATSFGSYLAMSHRQWGPSFSPRKGGARNRSVARGERSGRQLSWGAPRSVRRACAARAGATLPDNAARHRRGIIACTSRRWSARITARRVCHDMAAMLGILQQRLGSCLPSLRLPLGQRQARDVGARLEICRDCDIILVVILIVVTSGRI